MDLRQLRSLVALGDEEHFTRAARRLGIAQPALSQQIKRFETQIGVPLVERSTRSVRLTDAGRMVVAGARRVLREVETLSDEIDALRGVRSGRVVVGVTRTPGAVDVARLLARFAAAHPGVELDVREELTVELVSLLEAGALDLALIAEGATVVPPTLDVRTIAEDPLVAIVPAAHPLAGSSDVSIRDLSEQRLVTFHRGATIRTQLEQCALAERVPLRVGFEISDVQRAWSIVAEGLAVGVLPASDAGGGDERVVVVPLQGRELLHRTAVAVRRDAATTPAAAAFLELVGEAGDARA